MEDRNPEDISIVGLFRGLSHWITGIGFLLHILAGILIVSSQEDIGFTGWNTSDDPLNLINLKEAT